jgi:hypothetical protein
MYKQNLSVMGVASCRSAFLCLMSRVRLVPFRFWFTIGFRLVVMCVVGFDPRCGPAQPGPARAPLAPCAIPIRAPPPSPDPFVSFDFSRAVTSLSLFHLSLSPHGALGFGVEIAGIWIPGGEFSPSPSLSLSRLSLPFFSPARPARRLGPHAPCAASRPRARRAPGRAPSPTPSCAVAAARPRRVPLPAPAPAPRPPRPPRARRRPTPRPPLTVPCFGELGARAPSRPRPTPASPSAAPLPRRLASRAPARLACPRHAQHTLAHATVVALRLTLVLILFNFCLVDMLRRALRRATVRSNFMY